MRRPVAAHLARALAAGLAATLLLSACTSDPEDPATPSPTAEAGDGASAEDVAALEAVGVVGEAGSAPDLEFETPFSVQGHVARVETEGSGADLVDGQELTLHYVVHSGEDGSQIRSTWEQETPDRILLGDAAYVPALNEVLAGQKVGVRVLFAAPGQAATETSEAFPSTIMAIEVVDAVTPPTRAEGEAVEPPAGLPEVTLGENGRPEIEFPDGVEKPTELVVQPLIRGEGAPVEAGQTITVHYTGWLWDDRIFDTSWEKKPIEAPIGVGNLVAGWDEGLVGQPVGSQLLLLVPPDKGYGAEGFGDIPPDATLVFVVDILSAR